MNVCWVTKHFISFNIWKETSKAPQKKRNWIEWLRSASREFPNLEKPCKRSIEKDAILPKLYHFDCMFRFFKLKPKHTYKSNDRYLFFFKITKFLTLSQNRSRPVFVVSLGFFRVLIFSVHLLFSARKPLKNPRNPVPLLLINLGGGACFFPFCCNFVFDLFACQTLHLL